MLQPKAVSPWPKLRQRFGALLRDVYCESVCEGAILISRVLPADQPGVPTPRVAFANVLVRVLAMFVAAVGRVERAFLGARGITVTEVRDATPAELQQKAGQLTGEGMLPSAYDCWLGARTDGRLRLRSSYDGPRLKALLDAGGALDDGASADRVCAPLPLDEETIAWVRERVGGPASDSRLQVWRALKRRLYHYDAGVYAFHAFPRNYLLSPAQWAALLEGRPRGGAAAALDVGAGDGSLTAAFRPLFGSALATEMTAPLVCRLRSDGLDAVVADSVEHPCVRDAPLDVAFILNVLDRCKDPQLLLRQVHAQLPADGWLVVSVVLPASQSDAAYAVGRSQTKWAVRGTDWEAAAASLVCDLLRPAGFSPLRLARAPYLCAGDRHSPVAALDACVVVLRRCEPRPRPQPEAGAAAAAAFAGLGPAGAAGGGAPARAAARPGMAPTAAGLQIADGVMPSAAQDWLGRPIGAPATAPPVEPCKPCEQ